MCLVALVFSVILVVEYMQFVQTAIITPLASEELFRYVSLGRPQLGSGTQANEGVPALPTPPEQSIVGWIKGW